MSCSAHTKTPTTHSDTVLDLEWIVARYWCNVTIVVKFPNGKCIHSTISLLVCMHTHCVGLTFSAYVLSFSFTFFPSWVLPDKKLLKALPAADITLRCPYYSVPPDWSRSGSSRPAQYPSVFSNNPVSSMASCLCVLTPTRPDPREPTLSAVRCPSQWWWCNS